MIDLLGDTELDLLLLPIVVTTLGLGQAIETCSTWFRRCIRLTLRHVAT